jgi:hypothetical protein
MEGELKSRGQSEALLQTYNIWMLKDNQKRGQGVICKGVRSSESSGLRIEI